MRSRLHECAGFVAVVSLLLQPLEEWERCKRFILVSLFVDYGVRVGGEGGAESACLAEVACVGCEYAFPCGKRWSALSVFGTWDGSP